MTRPFWRATSPSNVDDELAQHIELLVHRYVADGIPEHEARAEEVGRLARPPLLL